MNPLLSGNFQGLQHIGMPITDLARSRAFYERLGFKAIMTAEFVAEGEKGHVAMLQRESAVLELYQLPVKMLAEIRTKEDGHFDHAAFSVADVDAAFRELTVAGLSPEQPEPITLAFWEHGCRYFTIRGPDGEKLEFNQILSR